MLYFNNSQSIENISRILAEFTTGSKITNMLENLNMKNSVHGPNSTKWKRLHEAFCIYHNQRKSDDKIITCIEWIMSPQNYINQSDEWINARNELNKVLQFNGLTINNSGKVEKLSKPKDFSEAYSRYSSLKDKLKPFNIHPVLLNICNKEILRKDYFELIFESSKIIENKIQSLSGTDLLGTRLINKCFNIKKPIIVLNSLQTKEDKNQYLALKALLNFINYNYRNPRAHKVKYFNPSSEIDAIEAIIMISKAHYLLDKCSKSYLN